MIGFLQIHVVPSNASLWPCSEIGNTNNILSTGNDEEFSFPALVDTMNMNHHTEIFPNNESKEWRLQRPLVSEISVSPFLSLSKGFLKALFYGGVWISWALECRLYTSSLCYAFLMILLYVYFYKRTIRAKSLRFDFFLWMCPPTPRFSRLNRSNLCLKI